MPSPAHEPHGRTVLVVDDEPVVCLLVCRMLQDAGYEPEGAHSSAEALALLERDDSPFDLFVLDIRLPDDSGVRLAERIHQRYPSAPVLFMSGFPEASASATPSGTWAYLSKPFRHQQLETMVDDLLHRGGPARDA